MKDEKQKRRWVKRRLKLKQGPVVRTGMECQSITTGSGRYVQRYARCGVGCSVCLEEGANFQASRPGHGPYWYFERVVRGKRVRRYCGAGPMPRGFGEIPMQGLDNPAEPESPCAPGTEGVRHEQV